MGNASPSPAWPILAPLYISVSGAAGIFSGNGPEPWVLSPSGHAAHVAALTRPDRIELTIACVGQATVECGDAMPEGWAGKRLAIRTDLPASVAIDAGVLKATLQPYLRPELPFATIEVGIAKDADRDLDGDVDGADVADILARWGDTDGHDLADALAQWGDYLRR